jgi:hypothetical protein
MYGDGNKACSRQRRGNLIESAQWHERFRRILALGAEASTARWTVKPKTTRRAEPIRSRMPQNA